MPASRPLQERFWEKVNKQGPCGPYLDTPCWVWTASTNRRGYGLIGVRASKPSTAHRVSWELHHGTIPPSMHVLHRCHRASCVRPDHLYLGTAIENAKDRVTADRVNAVKGSGHPNSKLNENDVKTILQARAAGQTAAALAIRYGCAGTTIVGICSGRSWRHIDRTGLELSKLKPGPIRGSRHRHYRITPEVVTSVVQMHSQGCVQREIASKLGISRGSVYQILKKAGKVNTRRTSPSPAHSPSTP